MNDIATLFLTFLTYSILGWMLESVCCSFYYKKILDRGFLIGPYCPIYGVAAVSIILFLTKYQDDKITLFFMTVVIASIVEYITSYIMEKLFRTRWWDYSERSFNLNGRVCLLNSFLFGMLGVLLIDYINPFIKEKLVSIPNNILYPLAMVTLIIFILDIVASCNLVVKIKKSTDMLKKDCTNEINCKIRETIAMKSKLYLRINKAFPNYKVLPKKIKDNVNKKIHIKK